MTYHISSKSTSEHSINPFLLACCSTSTDIRATEYSRRRLREPEMLHAYSLLDFKTRRYEYTVNIIINPSLNECPADDEGYYTTSPLTGDQVTAAGQSTNYSNLLTTVTPFVRLASIKKEPLIHRLAHSRQFTQFSC